MNMPKINLDSIENPEILEIAKNITKKDGTLYASKPKKVNGLEQYIWRMVAFVVSPKPQHHCMPMGAEFDLYNWIEKNVENCVPYRSYSNMSESEREGLTNIFLEYKRLKPFLKEAEDTISNTVPKEQWHGIHRWARAFNG